MSTVRHPAVAGQFYPKDREVLARDVGYYLSPCTAALPAIGCVAPHAGYMYSGAVAGAVFAAVEIPKRCVVLCPNHTGMGMPLSIMSSGTWQTPLGAVGVDMSLAESIKQHFPPLSEDIAAHRSEHAIEVELPFLQSKNSQVTIVPIALGTAQFELLHGLGEAVAAALHLQDDPVLMIASSDMNHYENDRITRIKDHKAIDRILALDPLGLFDTIGSEDISMCGFGATVVMLTAAIQLGAKSAKLIKYATSGDVSGNRDRVVGYAGIVVR